MRTIRPRGVDSAARGGGLPAQRSVVGRLDSGRAACLSGLRCLPSKKGQPRPPRVPPLKRLRGSHWMVVPRAGESASARRTQGTNPADRKRHDRRPAVNPPSVPIRPFRRLGGWLPCGDEEGWHEGCTDLCIAHYRRSASDDPGVFPTGPRRIALARSGLLE